MLNFSSSTEQAGGDVQVDTDVVDVETVQIETDQERKFILSCFKM